MNGYDKFFKEARKASGRPTVDSQHQAKKMVGKLKPKSKATEKSFKVKTPSLSAEEQLRKVLAERMKKKKETIRRRRQKFPVGAAICAVACFAVAGVGYFQPDILDPITNRIDIGFLGKARAANTSEKKDAPPASQSGKESGVASAAKSATSEADPAAKSAETKNPTKEPSVPDVKNWTAEELSFFNKLNERKMELDQREAELNRLEEELQKQKVVLDEKIKQLEAMRVQISKTLKGRVAEDQEKVNKLVEFYSNMKPQQAAKIIETIHEDLAIEVLDKMKKKNAAEILNMIDPKKARRLSELLTGYQRSPASSMGDEAASDVAPEAASSEPSSSAQ